MADNTKQEFQWLDIPDGSGGFERKYVKDVEARRSKQDKVAKFGSTTKPIYTSAAGTFAECSTYAGGTAVTLNGTSKAASTASMYAPTSAGTSGQVLVSSGSGAPTWGNVASVQTCQDIISELS